jgi:chemotaxis protein CheX
VKVEYINPFIESTVNAMQTMAMISPKRDEIKVKKDGESATFDISGLIGIAGEALGSVVLSFPEDTALQVVSKFVGEELTDVNRDVLDAIGELTNIVAGGAKKIFSEQGHHFKISIPNVVHGKNHKINRPKDVPCISVTFSSDSGPFAVEVSLKIIGES